MNVLLIIMGLTFLLCFTIYQWWFQSSRFKQMAERDRDKVQALNRPLAWVIYSLVLFIAIIGIISFYIMQLMDVIMKLQN